MKLRYFLPTITLLFIRLLIRLRYKVVIKGLSSVEQHCAQSKQGILFLPNHPAYSDPLVLMTTLWFKFKIRPVMIQEIFLVPVLNTILRWVRTLPMPDFCSKIEQTSEKKECYEQTLKDVVDGLKGGENFLFYPSGRLKRQARERLEGCSGIHRLMHCAPESNIVLVRVNGLWGSRFSCAVTHAVPDLFTVVKQAAMDVIKAGIFFLPRRTVTVEFSLADKKLKQIQERLVLNKNLEQWYNLHVEELSLVPSPYHFSKIPEVKTKEAAVTTTPQTFPDFSQKLLNEVAKITQKEHNEICWEHDLGADLGLDSIEISEILLTCKEYFAVEKCSILELRKLGDILSLPADSCTPSLER